MMPSPVADWIDCAACIGMVYVMSQKWQQAHIHRHTTKDSVCWTEHQKWCSFCCCSCFIFGQKQRGKSSSCSSALVVQYRPAPNSIPFWFWILPAFNVATYKKKTYHSSFDTHGQSISLRASIAPSSSGMIRACYLLLRFAGRCKCEICLIGFFFISRGCSTSAMGFVWKGFPLKKEVYKCTLLKKERAFRCVFFFLFFNLLPVLELLHSYSWILLATGGEGRQKRTQIHKRVGGRMLVLFFWK